MVALKVCTLRGKEDGLVDSCFDDDLLMSCLLSITMLLPLS